MFSVTMDIDEKQRNEMMRILLEDKGVETRPLFYPVHTMPMYSHKYQMHPVAEKIHRTGFNIPSYPEMSVDDIGYVADSVKEVYNDIV